MSKLFVWRIGICAVMVLAWPLVVTAQTAADVAKRPVVPPTPKRLPDGKLNWTGFWVPVNGMLEVNIGLGGTDATKTGAPAARRAFTQYSELTPLYKARFDKITAAAAKGEGIEDPAALCYPPGMPRMMGMTYGMEVLQTPGQITITSEWQAASRRVWLNRSKHPPADELDPTYAGDSIGHWEGDTLVVDTAGIREDVWLNYAGLPHTKDTHVHEVFSEKEPGILVDDITIDDPGAFVSPWKETMRYRYRPDLSLREYVCLENNRNVDSHGGAKFDK